MYYFILKVDLLKITFSYKYIQNIGDIERWMSFALMDQYVL